MMNSKRLLVTGANGFVGRRLCLRAEEQGWVIRPTSRLKMGGENNVIGDIASNAEWSDALKGVDSVVHLAACLHQKRGSWTHELTRFRQVNVEGSRRLAETAAKMGVKRFLFLSSIKVNGEKTGDGNRPFTESDTPAPEDAYAVSKWEAENVLWEIEKKSSMEVVVIRPPLIYGPGVKANFLKLMELVDRGIPLPFGGIRNRRSLLSLTNLVDLIYRCLEHPEAAGQMFLASDGEDVSTPELARRIAKALGRPARLLPVPEWLMKLGGTITGKSAEVKRLCGSLQIDSSKARRLLGWTPPCAMNEELGRIAGWWKSADFAD